VFTDDHLNKDKGKSSYVNDLVAAHQFFLPLYCSPPYTMGSCVSTVDRAGKERSDMIDKEIEDHSKRFKRECKILLLGTLLSSLSLRWLTNFSIIGSGESGKSTIVKQMKIIHKEGFTDAELAEYRPIVFKNVLDSAQAIIIYMRKIGWDFVGFPNRVCSLSISLSPFS
jgi:guanine nucleotide-binding protein G(i) subunit alpha